MRARDESQGTLVTLFTLLRRSTSLFLVPRIDRKSSAALIRKNCLDIVTRCEERYVSCVWLTEDSGGAVV
jgi:hypothetical protein